MLFKYYLMIYAAVFLASAGQILLKKGIAVGGFRIRFLCINVWVVLGFGAMIFSMLLSVRGLRYVPLRDMAFILPMIYILVPLFSYIFLGERLSRRVIIGTALMIVGVIIFNIPI